MYRRLVILTFIVLAALAALTVLGYHAIEKWSEGLQWKRVGEFAEVAEQIRQDVKRKLDDFVQAEEDRPYTHYQYFYIPLNIANIDEQQQMPVARSPLAGLLENEFANGYFQIEPDGRIITVNDEIVAREGAIGSNPDVQAQTEVTRLNVENNLLPALTSRVAPSLAGTDVKLPEQPAAAEAERGQATEALVSGRPVSQRLKSKAIQSENYRIASLERQRRSSQVFRQSRAAVEAQMSSNEAVSATSPAAFEEQSVQKLGMLADIHEDNEAARELNLSLKAGDVRQEQVAPAKAVVSAGKARGIVENRPQSESHTTDAAGALYKKEQAETAFAYAPAKQKEQEDKSESSGAKAMNGAEPLSSISAEYDAETSGISQRPAFGLGGEAALEGQDTVLVRIEPFVAVVVREGAPPNSIFGGQVFLLRHVQIEDRHIRQGFRLNEARLIDEVRKSADLLKREGMMFSLPQLANVGADSTPVAESVAYEAVLDFGFGRLILHLLEQDPGWIGKQVAQLRHWYFSIVAVVFLAVSLGLLSLWRYAHAQMKLAEQKDDFISAVSHELRTPLTSIRMYSEMLEKKWVKSENKLREYYTSMRQESERLSRLIENVLDFSRIQKGRKKYHFSGGDLNESVAGVVEMMRPYAVQNGFSIKTELPPLPQIAFDHDAIKQIIVNLLDNAVKYARDAADRTITVRTRGDSRYVFIEVEDHGPGVPHTQRKKIFEQFYRTHAEATRETTGTGLGLALVKKFAQAHNGFVEILNAKPAGAIFRVALAVHI